MRIRRLNHSIYQIEYHIVWGTKYRRKFFIPVARKELKKCIYQLERTYPDWHIVSVNTDRDHIHLIIEFPPKYSIASVVQKLKAHTCFQLKKRFKYIRQIYEKNGSIWGVGYFVSTIGLNEEQIKRYVELQDKDNRGSTITDEFE